MSTKNFKRQYSIAFTILFFTLLVSSFSPVGAITSSPAPDDVTRMPVLTPKATTKATSSVKPTPNATDAAKKSAAPSAAVKGTETVAGKMTVYKGEVSATPSAIGKFLVKTDAGDKNVDTDKKTKVLVFDNGKKTISTVTKLKIGDKVSVLGTIPEGANSLLAQYILVTVSNEDTKERGAVYGTVSSREASGAAFILQVKSPSKNDEKAYVLNANSLLKVKDVENPKMSDIKIGDRVTLTFYTENSSSYITHIYSIPGRAAGLLRDIREASASPTAKPTEASTSKPSGSAKATTAASASAKASPTAKPSASASSSN